MSRLTDWIAWGAGRLGWPGLSGLALVAGAVATCVLVVRPMDAQVTRLEGQSRLLAEQRARSDVAAMVAQPVRDWRADLPTDHQAYGRLTRLFQAAKEAGLALDEGSYRTQMESQSGLGRLVISLPVSGDYTAVRGFLAQALNQDTAMALESLRFSREDMADTELLADMRFALYLGGRP